MSVALAAPAPDDDINIPELGDQIANLTLVQAVQLRKYLEEVHGIKASQKVQESKPSQEVEKVEVQTQFTVVLEAVTDPAKKIGIIKIFREMTGLGLKESKDKVESAPCNVRENCTKEEAEKLKSQLEAAGAKVSIK